MELVHREPGALARIRVEAAVQSQSCCSGIPATSLPEHEEEIEKRLNELNLGSERKETINVKQEEVIENPLVQSKLLWTVLIINFAFFSFNYYKLQEPI